MTTTPPKKRKAKAAPVEAPPQTALKPPETFQELGERLDMWAKKHNFTPQECLDIFNLGISSVATSIKLEGNRVSRMVRENAKVQIAE